MNFFDASREVISLIFSLHAGPEDVQSLKISVARKYGLDSIPKNSEIYAAANEDEKDYLRGILQLKPTRTLSGVAPVAVMTSPSPCPHGKCLPCPGGPDHPFASPQSYTGEEPAALRGRDCAYDPYRQVIARLSQFVDIGHHVDKIELIVMGGTITARDPAYQEGFMRECIRAMNEFGRSDHLESPSDYETLCLQNETSSSRCVAATFETRPDWCGKEEINRMLALGVTKVELGVQHTDDAILALNRRGHGVGATVEANRLLRDAGLKVGFHVMPNLFGATIEDDMGMWDALFSDPRFCPDFIKIYPTLVTPGSEIEDLWKEGRYTPYPEEDLVDLIAYAKGKLPEYVRLQRVQRDIPARLIVAGSKKSNFRQLAAERLISRGGACRCIRCREAGRRPTGGLVSPRVLRYECCGGTEFFLSMETDDALVGFSRLRFPSDPWREELMDSALLRELHVYGAVVPLSRKGLGREYQHREYGHRLLLMAEENAAEAGYRSLAVMSGIGVRPYYRRHGYERSGPYMKKRLA